MASNAPTIVVAIPAKDEAELLPPCLAAIGRQTGISAAEFAVVVSCNNCSDDSVALLQRLAPVLPFRLHIDEVTLPAAIAHAGGARRKALDVAADIVAENGILLTTDADGIVDECWIASTRAAFAGNIAAVAGRVSTDWEVLKTFPPQVLDVGAREWDYQWLSVELEALTDPELHDPWPRHNQECGANMAIRKAWYDRIGGLPVVRTGEDGAMFDAVRRRDGRIRHDLSPHVTVSARLVGRAQGGMADALHSRFGEAYLCGDLLEPADDLQRRNQWRSTARVAFQQGRLAEWARDRDIDLAVAQVVAKAAHFGEAWGLIEVTAPPLAKHRIAGSQLDHELDRIGALLAASGKIGTEPYHGR